MRRRHIRQPYDRWDEPPRVQPPPVVLSRSKGLVRLDTHAIRHKSLKDYRKAEQDLAKLQSELKRFREHDASGFRTWLHQTFGSLLTRQRELAQTIQDKQALLLEIEELADRYRLSDAAAYRIAVWRRAHPEEARAKDLEFEEERRRHEAERNERPGKTPGADDDEPGPDDDADDDWDDFFDATAGRPPRSVRRSPAEERTARDLYRTIVRQLHPDRHGAMSEDRKNLWHEAQEAYRRRDIATLHDVLARCDTGAAGLGQHTPVALIRRLTLQLRQAIQATRAEIRRTKSDAAWNYEARQKDPRYTNHIQAELRSAIHMTEHDLRSIDTVLAQLEREANRSQRQSTSRRRRPPPPDGMDELRF